MEKKLEQLLLEKKFQALTAEEKYYVTEKIEEAEYDRLHLFLKESKKSLQNTPAINAALKNNLLIAFRRQHKINTHQQQPAIVRLMRHRIPAWQAAAVIALLLSVHFWVQKDPAIIERPEMVYVHSTDTIYKEVSMPVPTSENPATKPPSRINVKPTSKSSPWKNEEAIVASVDSASLKYEAAQAPDSFNLMVSQPRGKSATQTADLWHLLEEVY
jgi:hypothetical protein